MKPVIEPVAVEGVEDDEDESGLCEEAAIESMFPEDHCHGL